MHCSCSEIFSYHNSENVIRYVPAYIADSVSRIVRKDDRCFRYCQSIPCCLNRGLGEIHHNAQPVHLLHYGLQKKYVWKFLYVKLDIKLQIVLLKEGNVKEEPRTILAIFMLSNMNFAKFDYSCMWNSITSILKEAILISPTLM